MCKGSRTRKMRSKSLGMKSKTSKAVKMGKEKMIWIEQVFFAIIPARGALIELY